MIREEKLKVLEEKIPRASKPLVFLILPRGLKLHQCFSLPDRSYKQKKPLYIPICMIPNL
ncbi:hypothetical protein BSMD_003820 [Bacillus subtilis Miyagi-4]|nr:hypothetical protein BSMD_003820 [Bacillus subtilis Miyagi-4]